VSASSSRDDRPKDAKRSSSPLPVRFVAFSGVVCSLRGASSCPVEPAKNSEIMVEQGENDLEHRSVWELHGKSIGETAEHFLIRRENRSPAIALPSPRCLFGQPLSPCWDGEAFGCYLSYLRCSPMLARAPHSPVACSTLTHIIRHASSNGRLASTRSQQPRHDGHRCRHDRRRDPIYRLYRHGPST